MSGDDVCRKVANMASPSLPQNLGRTRSMHVGWGRTRLDSNSVKKKNAIKYETQTKCHALIASVKLSGQLSS